MKKRGSVTIFICLIFICISALICGLLESARTSSARLYLQTAGDSAIDSLFSRYHRQLWENYKILSLESESDEKIKDLMLEYMKPYVENSGMYRISNPQININKKINLYDNGGMYLEQEIIDYMSLGIFESFFEGSPEDLYKNIEDAKSMNDITGDYAQVSKEAVEVEKVLMRISENINTQENIKSQMREALNLRNIFEIKNQVRELKNTLEKIPELIKKYENNVENMSQRINEVEEENAENMEKLSESNREYIEGEILKFKEYVERDGERYQEVAALEGLSKDIVEDLEKLEVDIAVLEEAMEEDEDDESGDSLMEAWNTVEGDINSLGSMSLNFQFGIADENKEDMLNQLKNLISDGILSLVIPEGREVSGKSINTLALPSNAITGGYVEGNLAKRLLIDEYIGLYFADFTDGIEMPLNYEVEYILNGKASDRENLESAVLKLFGLREGLNYMHIISSTSKIQQAEALAAGISGVLCLPQLTVLLKFLIITVWASVESAEDVRSLLSGGKVPLFKTDQDWSTDPDNMFAILDRGKLEEKESSKEGLNYEEYLKLFLFLTDPVKRNFRIMDIIQSDLGVKQNGFLIKDMIYGFDANISCGGSRLFSEISYMSSEFAPLSPQYGLKIKVEKIY